MFWGCFWLTDFLLVTVLFILRHHLTASCFYQAESIYRCLLLVLKAELLRETKSKRMMWLRCVCVFFFLTTTTTTLLQTSH